MRPPRGPRFPMGAAFAGALFATAIIGWFWIGQLAAVGAGWHPIMNAAAPLLLAAGR